MKLKFMLALLAVTLLTGAVFVDSQSAASISPTMDHEWAYEIGDTIYLNGNYYIIWKRMEALHPENMKLYYYYQIAVEDSMTGHWVWEGHIDGGETRSGQQGEQDPPPGYCPPNGTPPPC